MQLKMTIEFSFFRLFMKNVDKSIHFVVPNFFDSKFSEREKVVDLYKSDTLSFILNFNEF
jgi:hypothetical protein